MFRWLWVSLWAWAASSTADVFLKKRKDDEYFFDVQTIIREDETGGPARLVLVVRTFPDCHGASDFCDWVVAGIVGDELKAGRVAIPLVRC